MKCPALEQANPARVPVHPLASRGLRSGTKWEAEKLRIRRRETVARCTTLTRDQIRKSRK